MVDSLLNQRTMQFITFVGFTALVAIIAYLATRSLPMKLQKTAIF
jgi:hypothetical protein